MRFIKEIIDLTKREKRKKRKRKQKIEIIKTEKKKKKVKKLNDKNLKLAKKNSKLLKKNLYKFDLNTMLNKPQYFDLGMTTEDQIFDKIPEGIPANNDEYYIEHSDKSQIFTVKGEPKREVKKER